MKISRFTLILFSACLLISFSFQAQDVKVADNALFGQVLTDTNGKTLYFFSRDAEPNSSACTGGCLDAWPIFHVPNIIIDTGLDANDFSEFQRSDGQMQSTYKGWPLYYFVNDPNPGDTNGDGINNIWYVAKPDYSFMLINNQLVGLDGINYTSNYEPGDEIVQYFVDSKGHTIYVWSNDFYNDNNFTASDFSNNAVWPVYEEDLQAIPSTVDKSLFGSIDVYGHQQLTYNGWPLYFFGQDAERGETKGVSVPVPGIWPVATPGIEPAIINSSNEIPETISFVSAPNPFSERLVVTITLNKTTEIRTMLFDQIGRLQHETSYQTLLTGENQIEFNNLKNLPNGIYFLRLQSLDGNTGFTCVIKI